MRESKFYTVEVCDCIACQSHSANADSIQVALNKHISSVVYHVKEQCKREEVLDEEIKVGDIVHHRTELSIEMVVYSVGESISCRWWYNGQFWSLYFDRKELIKP